LSEPIGAILRNEAKIIALSSSSFSYAETSMTAANDLAVWRALEITGIKFIDENGG
jgi:hypothetical protein